MCVNKACGMDSLSAEHLLYPSPEIHTLLAVCFNAFIVHGFLPSSLTDSVIIPIVQDKCKNISDIGNYRPIALSYVLSKVFELILLSKLNSYFAPLTTSSALSPITQSFAVHVDLHVFYGCL